MRNVVRAAPVAFVLSGAFAAPVKEPAFVEYIGIDYSGALTPTTRVKGHRSRTRRSRTMLCAVARPPICG